MTILFAGIFILGIFKANAQIGGGLNKLKSAGKEAKDKKEVTPENQTKQSETDTKTTTLVNQEKTDGITSPLHQKYLGKIVFTKTALGKDEIKETDFLQSYTMGDPLAFRVYMDNSLTNYLVAGYADKDKSALIQMGTYSIKFYVDGVEAYKQRFTKELFDPEEKNMFTTWKGTFTDAQKSDLETTRAWTAFKKASSDKLTIGEHMIKIEVMPDIQCLSCKEKNKDFSPVATGEIKVVIAKSIVDPNDPLMCMPYTDVSNVPLETEFLKLTSKEKTGWEEQSVKVKLKTNDWTLIRNDLGKVLSKERNAYVGLKKGDICTYMLFTFSKDFDGVNYGETKVINFEGTKKIPCDCLK